MFLFCFLFWRYSSTGITPVDMPAKVQQSPLQVKVWTTSSSWSTNKLTASSTTTKKKNITWQMDVFLTVSSKRIPCERVPSVGVSRLQWEYFVLRQMLMTRVYKSRVVSARSLARVVTGCGVSPQDNALGQTHRAGDWQSLSAHHWSSAVEGGEYLPLFCRDLTSVRRWISPLRSARQKAERLHSHEVAEQYVQSARNNRCISELANSQWRNHYCFFPHQIKYKPTYKQLLYELLFARVIWGWIYIILTACALFATISLG